MTVIPWNELTPNGPYSNTASALTVGVFDGVHLGHRAVIERVVRNDAGLLPVAVTFSNNPQNVLLGTVRVKEILTITQKLSIIESLGVAVTVMIDFSVEFSKMDAKSFFIRLAEAFRIQKFVEGDNFHFGSGREAGRQTLRAFCDGVGAVLETPERVTHKGAPVSSTRLRHAIRTGQLADVSAMLAGEYTVVVPEAALRVPVSGEPVVRKNGLSQVVPDAGRYRCVAETDSVVGESEVFIDHDSLTVRAVTGHAMTGWVKTITFKEKMP